MSGQSERLNWVDTAKGISIILVVMMHSAFGVGDETGGTGVLHWIIAFATPFRMPEFFLISGLFLANVINRDWRSFADRRVVHYLYFYALWAVLHIAFKVGLGAGDPLSALNMLAWSIVEPYGVLWFIYMLAVVSAATKLLHSLRIPHAVTIFGAMLLQFAPITTGIYVVDQFAEYFIYFYAGYFFAPVIFKLVDWAMSNVALAASGLLAWALINGALVFTPGYEVLPAEVHMGLANATGLHLILALVGSVALCVTAGLLSLLPVMNWLRWLGSKSIVVYLAFAIPMAVTRTVLMKLDLTDNTSIISLVVMASAILMPLALYWAVQKTGFGTFLFERPTWAHLPGTKGSRQARAHAVPAE